MSNTNTLNALIAEAARISAAHKAQPAPEHVQAMHDLHENAKQVLSRDEYALLWERICPKASGVDGFAGRKWRAAHPDAGKSAMPAYITAAQAERKAAADAKKAADKPADKPARKSTRKAASKPADKPAKAKEPTQKELLMALLAGQQELLLAIRDLAK